MWMLLFHPRMNLIKGVHMTFLNRAEAGKLLAEKLAGYGAKTNLLVLALPRGGVPVAYEVAVRLQAPLDVLVVRKLGVPGQEELAMGALASGEVIIINDDVIRHCRVDRAAFDQVVEAERIELSRREKAYRNGRDAIEIKNKVCILIDDGIATGASMRAACLAVRKQIPEKL